MRKLIVAEHLSLDGVMQAPGGPDEDPSGDFKLGGWEAPFDDDAVGTFLMEMFSKPFELLLGRRTYDIWAAYWPKVPSDAPGVGPIAHQFNTTTKHVATHRPESLTWKNSHGMKGDVAAAVRALKEEKGPDLLTWGSANLVQQLAAAGLVDRFEFMIYPVVLGKGKKLFGDDAQPASFKMTHSVVVPNGVILARYEKSGDVRTGRHGPDVK